MKQFIAYKILCQITGKAYIGITTGSLIKRWTNHVYQSKKQSKTKLAKAIRKYGKENFTIEAIAESTNMENLIATERDLIKQYDSFCKGYNTTEGGYSGNWISRIKRSRSLISFFSNNPDRPRSKYCDRGHEYSEDNISLVLGNKGIYHRRCRKCHALATMRYLQLNPRPSRAKRLKPIGQPPKLICCLRCKGEMNKNAFHRHASRCPNRPYPFKRLKRLSRPAVARPQSPCIEIGECDRSILEIAAHMGLVNAQL